MDCKQLQDAIEQVLMRGFLNGFKEGSHEARLEIAKNMLMKNLHVSFIENITGVSAQQIEKLK